MQIVYIISLYIHINWYHVHQHCGCHDYIHGVCVGLCINASIYTIHMYIINRNIVLKYNT